jgi:hypothetical protein
MTMRLTNAQVMLFALCGLLGIALIYELFAPLREYTPPAQGSTHAAFAATTPAMYTPPAFETFANIDERSVFNPLRTPIASDSGVTTAAGDALPADLALVGVILDGATKMALLKSSSAPQVVAVPQGGVFEGWQVSSVEPDKVVFAAHGDRQELKLSDNKPPAAAAQDQSDAPDHPDAPEHPAPQVQPQATPQPPPQPAAKTDDDSDQ